MHRSIAIVIFSGSDKRIHFLTPCCLLNSGVDSTCMSSIERLTQFSGHIDGHKL